jgi:hypothetical protein
MNTNLKITQVGPYPIRIAFRLSLHESEQWTTAGLGALRAIGHCVPYHTPNRTKRIMSLVQDAE